MRETHQLAAPAHPLLGIEPATGHVPHPGIEPGTSTEPHQPGWRSAWREQPAVDCYTSTSSLFICFLVFLKIYFIDFLQRGRERDRELETSMREKHRSAASCTSPTGDVPATQVHALDRNRTWDPSVRRPTLYPSSQTGFGYFKSF
uniref:Uncharacterized protein n=1 Tax=Myotis myotis TaxID=51298 RepID=A0A7J7Y0N0_MYOMY|nr:hypothetical protein mMyoMyo1_011516 [Myotis myotis]